MAPLFSKDDLQRELDLSCCRLCAGYLAGILDSTALLIEEQGLATCPARGREVCAIQDVEDLGPQLHIHAVRSRFDVVVLEERHIQIDEPRADHRIAADVAESRDRVRHREALRLDVVRRVARIDRVVATRPAEKVRERERVAALRAERISIDERGEWTSAADRQYGADLPPAAG